MDSEKSASVRAFVKEMTCPITQELMVDPVLAEDGHTYERIAIERWFDTGKTRSPVTNEELPRRTLIPNHLTRKLIDSHRRTYGNHLVELCSRGSPDTKEVLQLLENGADTDVRDAEGNTPLMMLVSCYDGRVELVNALLARGAKVAAVNDGGKTALDIAKDRGALDLQARFEPLAEQEREQRLRDDAARLRQRDENRLQQRQRQSERRALFPDVHTPPGSFSQSTGFFPSLFGLQFQSLSDNTPVGDGLRSVEHEKQILLSRVLLVIGSFVILCLLFA